MHQKLRILPEELAMLDISMRLLSVLIDRHTRSPSKQGLDRAAERANQQRLGSYGAGKASAIVLAC
jgi:hypothetical protein